MKGFNSLHGSEQGVPNDWLYADHYFLDLAQEIQTLRLAFPMALMLLPTGMSDLILLAARMPLPPTGMTKLPSSAMGKRATTIQTKC